MSAGKYATLRSVGTGDRGLNLLNSNYQRESTSMRLLLGASELDARLKLRYKGNCWRRRVSNNINYLDHNILGLGNRLPTAATKPDDEKTEPPLFESIDHTVKRCKSQSFILRREAALSNSKKKNETNLTHYAYPAGIERKNDPQKIINQHRFSQIPMKQIEDESYEKYRKNRSFIDGVQRYNTAHDMDQFEPNQNKLNRSVRAESVGYLSANKEVCEPIIEEKDLKGLEIVVSEKELGTKTEPIKSAQSGQEEQIPIKNETDIATCAPCVDCYNKRAAIEKAEKKLQEKVREKVKELEIGQQLTLKVNRVINRVVL